MAVKKTTLIKTGEKFFDLFCDIMNAGFERGMSQLEIANLSGVNPSTLSSWVTGNKHGYKDLNICLSLAQVTGFPQNEIMASFGWEQLN